MVRKRNRKIIYCLKFYSIVLTEDEREYPLYRLCIGQELMNKYTYEKDKNKKTKIIQKRWSAKHWLCTFLGNRKLFVQ